MIDFQIKGGRRNRVAIHPEAKAAAPHRGNKLLWSLYQSGISQIPPKFNTYALKVRTGAKMVRNLGTEPTNTLVVFAMQR